MRRVEKKREGRKKRREWRKKKLESREKKREGRKEEEKRGEERGMRKSWLRGTILEDNLVFGDNFNLRDGSVRGATRLPGFFFLTFFYLVIFFNYLVYILVI